MYVWQMNNGRWHISMLTGRSLSGTLSSRCEAHRLMHRGYDTETEARAAERHILTLIEVAA